MATPLVLCDPYPPSDSSLSSTDVHLDMPPSSQQTTDTNNMLNTPLITNDDNDNNNYS